MEEAMVELEVIVEVEAMVVEEAIAEKEFMVKREALGVETDTIDKRMTMLMSMTTMMTIIQ